MLLQEAYQEFDLGDDVEIHLATPESPQADDGSLCDPGGNGDRLSRELRSAHRDAARATAKASRLRPRKRAPPSGGADGGRPKRVTGASRKRAQERAELEEGEREDSRGFHAIEEIIDVRSGARAQREALVRWRGTDPATGSGWPDQWLEFRRLTPDLRPTAAEMLAAKYPKPQREQFRGRPAGARESPRLQELGAKRDAQDRPDDEEEPDPMRRRVGDGGR